MLSAKAARVLSELGFDNARVPFFASGDVPDGGKARL